MKNLFKDFPREKAIDDELEEAHEWVKNIIKETNKYRYYDPFWEEYPLIQRDAVFLNGDHLRIFRRICLQPTANLNQIFLKSGLEERKFYKIVNYLVQHNYLKILPVYYSIEFSVRHPESSFFKIKN